MKDDYLVNGMPSEIERIMNIRRTNNISLMDARIILKNETDYLAINENNTKLLRIRSASIELLVALEAIFDEHNADLSYENYNMAKSAIYSAYNG